MALQPNSYKKFVTSAATAALVASALIPAASAAETKSFTDVSKSYKDAVDYLVANKIASGTTDTTFGTSQNISRGDAAVMIANALKLDTANAKDAGFQDVNARVAGAVNAIVEAGIASGKTSTSFDPSAYITRQEMAKMLANAYGLTAKENASFTDVNSNWIGFVSALKENGITLGKTETTFAPTANLSRGEFALFVFRAEVTPTPGEAVVTSVSAANASTLTVTGTGLTNLKAEDITVEGNTVSSVSASTDGKSATVTLGTLLNPNVEYSVKTATKEFKVTYSLVADQAAVTEATYDDDRADQFVAFNVNGVKANVADLIANGYTVDFSATNKDANAPKTEELFKNAKTGELNAVAAGTTYKVQVTISNGTKVIVSPVQEIKIKNLDLAATTINSYEFENTTIGGIVQNSTKLVVGDTGSFTQLKVLADGSEDIVRSGYKVESSNKAVASVNSAGVVTANTPGTTTLTITYGNVTKTVSFTVQNEERKVKSVKVTKVDTDTQIYNLTAIKGSSDVTISPLDQYGDPMNETISIESSDDAIVTASAESVTAGEAKLTINAKKAGSATLMFKNDKKVTLSTFGVKVTENAGVSTKKLEIVAPKVNEKKSADNTLDLSDDTLVEYKLNQYNSEGVANGSVDLGAYEAVSSDDSVATVVKGTDNLTITGVKKGTATISLKDAAKVNVGTITVTVVDNGATITAVAFKPQSKLDYAKTVDYKTFLTYTASAGKDPAISGVTLSKTTTNKVRLTEDGKLYLDANGDSEFNTGDNPLGQIGLIATSDSTGLSTTAVLSEDVQAKDKGTLIFTVKEIVEPGETAKIYASTSLEVDVK